MRQSPGFDGCLQIRNRSEERHELHLLSLTLFLLTIFLLFLITRNVAIFLFSFTRLLSPLVRPNVTPQPEYSCNFQYYRPANNLNQGLLKRRDVLLHIIAQAHLIPDIDCTHVGRRVYVFATIKTIIIRNRINPESHL
eukprot:g44793.t1